MEQKEGEEVEVEVKWKEQKTFLGYTTVKVIEKFTMKCATPNAPWPAIPVVIKLFQLLRSARNQRGSFYESRCSHVELNVEFTARVGEREHCLFDLSRWQHTRLQVDERKDWHLNRSVARHTQRRQLQLNYSPFSRALVFNINPKWACLS